MPHGYPSATVTTRTVTAYALDTFKLVSVPCGDAVEILGKGADQDGARGDELACRVAGSLVLLSASALLLSS